MNIKTNKGYTLTELLIALAVTAIMVSVIFSAFSLCRRVSLHNSNKVAAINILKLKIEEIRGDIKTNQFDNVSSLNGEVSNHVIWEGPSAAPTDDINGSLSVTLNGKDASDTDVALTDINLAYVELEVTIIWNHFGPPFSETITVETNITQ